MTAWGLMRDQLLGSLLGLHYFNEQTSVGARQNCTFDQTTSEAYHSRKTDWFRLVPITSIPGTNFESGRAASMAINLAGARGKTWYL
jgi:hypothetical protein